MDGAELRFGRARLACVRAEGIFGRTRPYNDRAEIVFGVVNENFGPANSTLWHGANGVYRGKVLLRQGSILFCQGKTIVVRVTEK